ncbi:MAG: exosortase-associated EpsI family protein, partial [Pseudomonadota bacterium]
MEAVPQRSVVLPERDVFAVFPRQMGEWRQVGVPQTLEASVAKALKADDYHSVNFQRAAGE